MIRTIAPVAGPLPFHWLDVVAPTPGELHEIGVKYGFHPKQVEDCLDPEHLPKVESMEDRLFFISRAYDRGSTADAYTVQQLTRKIAVFTGPDFVVTVHRVPLPLIDELERSWLQRPQAPAGGPIHLLVELLNAVVASYETPLQAADEAVSVFENTVFANQDVLCQLERMHALKGRIATYRRLLWYTLTAIQKIHSRSPHQAPLLQDLRENAEASHALADELIEDINSLLHIQLGMASHRTNEVVRLLTLFSVFFLPLTFVAGVYGMNFRHMPELEWRLGYPLALLLMLGVSGAILLWFKRRGFLR